VEEKLPSTMRGGKICTLTTHKAPELSLRREVDEEVVYRNFGGCHSDAISVRKATNPEGDFGDKNLLMAWCFRASMQCDNATLFAWFFCPFFDASQE